jgi:DNA helicase-2/ATP-dependent DNA helicase PcrA
LCTNLKIQGLRAQWELLKTKLHDLSELDDEQILEQLLPSEGLTKELSEQVRALRYFCRDDEDVKLSDLLTQAVVSQDNANDEARVNIMTLFGAKGLTSHTVILTSLISGLLPTKPSPNTPEEREKLEEERRLVYVALTRAKKRLILSSFRKVRKTENDQLKLGLHSSGRYCGTTSSKFISEFGSDTPNSLSGDDWLLNIDS